MEAVSIAEPAQAPAPATRLTARALKACRRCRRLRIKCTNQGAKPPCDNCRQANEDCTFPLRGQSEQDRAYRHPRGDRRASAVQQHGTNNHDHGVSGAVGAVASSSPVTPALSSGSRSMSRSIHAGSGATEINLGASPSHNREALRLPNTPSLPRQTGPGWESLPPFEEVVDGVRTLTTSFFQLGFLPKSLFFEELRKDRNSVSVFLLFGILSVSARFTPSLVKRYEAGAKATQLFLDRASYLVPEHMFNPTLDSIQGFFLMSIAEWGNGDKNRSLVYMGIAIRLAGILKMHREEAYQLPDGATNEEVVRSEVARRTFWMLETFENLHSGSDSPGAFSYSGISVLLPCDEREFTFGVRPAQRAALMGTPPAIQNPELACLPSRSLFATLLQTHNLWGQVARLVSADAVQLSSPIEARVSADDYGLLSRALREFEAHLPQQHSWSAWNLRGYKIEGLDLAYLSVTMVLRLSNIILRRSFLHDILGARQQNLQGNANLEHHDSPSTNSWPSIAEELFDNMLLLDEQITAFFEYRSSAEHDSQGYPAIIVFCVYVCGSLANHLHQQPQTCPRVAPYAARVARSSIKGLGDLQSAWPLARHWYLALCKASENARIGNPAATVVEQQHDQASVPGTGGGALVQPQAPGDNAGDLDQTMMDTQFNVPFFSDSMFEAFDAYMWSNSAPT
ncbi:hypothetical protein SLS62_006192 [Diatrype stigma]|uniref:Zn(2)-C6 fungal-type domain-containing protein n=1 Tax=Diatrype stigma TaxID=117547 RepID=A0AAN9URG6_9PEZI